MLRAQSAALSDGALMMIPARTITVVALACSVLLSSGASALAPRDSLGHWVDLVAARNAIAHDVVAYKFPVGRPIEDPVREVAVLEDKRARAVQMGLDPEQVVAAYRQLIEANKLLQHVDVQRFLTGTPAPSSPPLEAIRERIDEVDARLLSQWSGLRAVRSAEDCSQRLAQAIALQGLPWKTVDEPSRIALVRATVGFCAVRTGPGGA